MLPRVPLEACIQQWAAAEEVDYHSAAAGRRTQASKTSRFASFPPFLFVQLRRCRPCCAAQPPQNHPCAGAVR